MMYENMYARQRRKQLKKDYYSNIVKRIVLFKPARQKLHQINQSEENEQ